MIGLSYKQKCNNFGYLSIQVWLKGNDTTVTFISCDVIIYIIIGNMNKAMNFFLIHQKKTRISTYLNANTKRPSSWWLTDL